MPRIASLLVGAAVVAAAGAYGWHAWDTGLIPGNPRAPLPKNFETALRVALKDSVPEDPLCHPLSLYGVRGETYRVGGVQNMPNQGLFSITLAPELGGQERVRQISMFEGLAKAGIFSAKDAEFQDESGTQRKARSFRLTPNGWLQMTSSDCLWLGRREFSGITKFAKMNATDKSVAYEITYEVKLPALPAWAELPDAGALFPRLAEFKGPLERRAQLVRTPDGWTAKLAKIVPRGSDAGRDAPPVFVDVNPGLKPPPLPSLEEASKLVAASSQAGALTACLNLPFAQMADGVGDFQNQDREKPYFASYYDDPARPPSQPTGRADGLALMRALQKIGMVDEEPAEDFVFNGKRRPGGATFTLKQTYKVLMDPRQPGCLPIASLSPEVKVVRDTRTAAGIAGQTSHYVEIRGVSKVASLLPWVKETGADKALELVRMVVEEGLPLGGMLVRNPNADWQASSLAAPRLVYQGSDAPAALFAMLPRFSGAPAKTGASEAHAVIVYEGPAARAPGQQFAGAISVTVGRTARPVELVLSAYSPVEWKLTLEPGAQLKRIVTVGYGPQQVTGAPRTVPVENGAGQMGAGMGRYLPYAAGGGGNEAMTVGALKAMTTAPIASIQTAYRGSYFPVGDVKSAPPASAQNLQAPGDATNIRQMPGRVQPYAVPAYPYSPPPAVMVAPSGSQGAAQGSAIQAVPAPYGGPSQGYAIPVQPQGSAARAQSGAPAGSAAKELRRMRCGSSTIVCEAGSTAMCEGKPVACN
jgi:hypothetical protein